jgi:hypothetical protein
MGLPVKLEFQLVTHTFPLILELPPSPAGFLQEVIDKASAITKKVKYFFIVY